MHFKVLEHHSMWHPLSDWLINDYLLSSFHGPWKPLNWNAVPNYPLVIMVILPNRMWASHPDSLSGAGRKVGWDKEEPTLNPEGSTWLSKWKVVPTIGCRIVTKHGMRALNTWCMSQTWKYSRKELGCYKQHLLLSQVTEPASFVGFTPKWLFSCFTWSEGIDKRVKYVCSTSWWHLWMLQG